jgi:hypothetical protein
LSNREGNGASSSQAIMPNSDHKKATSWRHAAWYSVLDASASHLTSTGVNMVAFRENLRDDEDAHDHSHCRDRSQPLACGF